MPKFHSSQLEKKRQVYLFSETFIFYPIHLHREVANLQVIENEQEQSSMVDHGIALDFQCT